MADKKITELTELTVIDLGADWVPVVDTSTGETKKITPTNLGAQGAQGVQGVQGTQGTQGLTGAQGFQGYQGTQGDTGSQGNNGAQGAQGSQGTQGVQGVQGTQGNQGNQGNQGYQGNQGGAGVQGDQGYPGNVGAQGNQGTQGNQGYQGYQGAAGATGATAYGELSVTNNATAQTLTTQNTWYVWNTGYASGENNGFTPSAVNGTLTNTSGSITVETLASISFSGTASETYEWGIFLDGSLITGHSLRRALGTGGDVGAATCTGVSAITNGQVLDIRVRCTTASNKTVTWQEGSVSIFAVSGAQGSQGTQGVQGVQGTQGYQGNQGNQGTQGTTGAQGDQGYQGNQGTQGSQGSQGNQGYQGDVGAQGNQGYQGYQGNQGNQGTQGNQGNQGNQGASGLAGGTLTGVINLGENFGLELDSALSADGKYSGIVEAGTAGATLGFGDLCYLDPTDSRWELTDANAAAAADGDSRGKLGICVLAAAGDGSATTMLLWGKVRADGAFPTFTVNNPVYISETAGDVTGTQPTTADVVIRVVGFGNTGDELFFCPSADYITHT